MNRKQWHLLRHAIHANGAHWALRWATPDHGEALIEQIRNLRNEQDWIAERADIVAYCKREGLTCTPRQTGRHPRHFK